MVRTVPVADPGDLAGQLPGSAPLAWIHRGEGLVGWGEVARVTLPAGQDRFTAAEKWLRALLDERRVNDQVGCPGLRPGGVRQLHLRPGLGRVRPHRAAGGARPPGRPGLAHHDLGPPGPPAPHGWPAAAGPARAAQAGPAPATPGEVRWHDGSLTAPQWERAVATAVARIRAGGLRKVVLARDLHASAAGPHRRDRCCCAGWPRATRTATRSPAAGWPAPPLSC